MYGGMGFRPYRCLDGNTVQNGLSTRQKNPAGKIMIKTEFRNKTLGELLVALDRGTRFMRDYPLINHALHADYILKLRKEIQERI